MSLTKQEMFDRAYRGLASQGWKRAYGPAGCVYQTDDGRRCAWGWVDLGLDSRVRGSVEELRERRQGLVSELDDEHYAFADRLQLCHDTAIDASLKKSFDDLARRFSLSIPELP